MADTSVHVCCVHPGGIKTNIAEAARGGARDVSARERGERFRDLARSTPEQAADKILGAIEKRKKRLLIGSDAYLVSALSRLFPVAYSSIMAKLAPLDPDKI